MIRVGLVGCGHMGKFHADKVGKITGAQLVSVMDADPQRAKEVSEKYSATPYREIKEFAKSIDFGIVASATESHFPIAQYLIQQGVPLLVEKPLADSFEKASHLVELAEDNGTLLYTGHVERFNPVLREIRKEIANERVLAIETFRHATFKPRGTDVSVLKDLLIHDLDFVASVLEEEEFITLKAIEARGLALRTPFLDTAVVTLRSELGTLVHLSVSRVSGEPQREVRLLSFQRMYRAQLAKSELTISSTQEPEIRVIQGGDALEAQLRACITRSKDAVTARSVVNVYKLLEQVESLAMREL